ncbi:unnamed protein product [Acanthoscelides obtectus]|uniref:Uncharacterized protein n=1 Tax=Acanthoscelides obtectus TaxID=200917 RepID=A0A9P0JX05_ACAOB|nr:unnamed protein product [Acanthoscelides obtectus]CAK1632045.1 hypothetical protein AOBTE_LOCUS7324 [Acanthoscelides obtectus]
MKSSAFAAFITCLICAVRCGVVFDKLKKVRCDLHQVGESILSHGHLINDPCPHKQVTDYNGEKNENYENNENSGKHEDNEKNGNYGQNQHEISTKTSNNKHTSTTEDVKYEQYIHGTATEKLPGSSTEKNKHGSHDQKGSDSKPVHEKTVHEASTEAVKHKLHGNNADGTYQKSSDDNGYSKKNIDMDGVHSGAILFPEETESDADDINDRHLKGDTESDYHPKSTTMANVLTTTTPDNLEDPLNRNLGKVKPNCAVVDKNKNCIQDYS